MKRQPERAEQASTKRLLRALGAEVWSLGTTRRKGDHPGTMQDAGLPDLIAFLPGRQLAVRVMLVVECKAKGGRLRPEQKVFRAMCLDAGVEHVVGDLDAVIAWLVAKGYLKRESLPHYRLP